MTPFRMVRQPQQQTSCRHRRKKRRGMTATVAGHPTPPFSNSGNDHVHRAATASPAASETRTAPTAADIAPTTNRRARTSSALLLLSTDAQPTYPRQDWGGRCRPQHSRPAPYAYVLERGENIWSSSLPDKASVSRAENHAQPMSPLIRRIRDQPPTASKHRAEREDDGNIPKRQGELVCRGWESPMSTMRKPLLPVHQRVNSSINISSNSRIITPVPPAHLPPPPSSISWRTCQQSRYGDGTEISPADRKDQEVGISGYEGGSTRGCGDIGGWRRERGGMFLTRYHRRGGLGMVPA